jgi:hypothetical protein
MLDLLYFCWNLPLLQIPIISFRQSNRMAIKLKVMSGAYVLHSNCLTGQISTKIK